MSVPAHAPTSTIRTATIDWLTATACTDVGRAEYQRIASVLALAEDAAGNKPQQWLWQGYAGWHAGGLTYGERPDGAILRLSGSLAAANWRDAVLWAHNISRLDLAVTVHLVPFPQHLGGAGYRGLLEDVPAGGIPPNASLHISTDGGETLYLGKRASDKYARLYNKEAESKDPEYRSTWRYEVELKNKPAKSVANRLMSSREEGPLVATYVWRHFADRHVAPTFAPAVGDGLISVPRSRSTDERRIIWLETQVRGVVEELIRRGRAKQVRVALGL
jgi:hypothetical protein